MDKYWSEFLVSEDFKQCEKRYEYAYPLEATFWSWFKDHYLENTPPKKMEEYL